MQALNMFSCWGADTQAVVDVTIAFAKLADGVHGLIRTPVEHETMHGVTPSTSQA